MRSPNVSQEIVTKLIIPIPHSLTHAQAIKVFKDNQKVFEALAKCTLTFKEQK